MQDYSDRALDSLIEQSLRSEAFLRPGQQQRAWEALRARVAAEPAPVETMPARRRLLSALRAAGRWIVWLCVEESHYERATRHRLETYPLSLTGEPLGGGVWVGMITRTPSFRSSRSLVLS